MGGSHSHTGGPIGDAGSPVHRLDPRAKTLGLVGVTVVGVSATVSAWPAWVGCAIVLAAVALVARIPPMDIWRRSRAVLPLVILVAAFIPFFRGGDEAFALGPLSVSREGLEVLGEVSAKATIGTVSAVLLAATTTVPAIIRGLETMRVPRLLVLIASFMYRYLFVIADELRRMRSALASRAYRPRHLLAVGPLGRMATALFLRSYSRGERVYLAMMARGYSGQMPRLDPLRLARADAVFVGLIVLALVPLRALS